MQQEELQEKYDNIPEQLQDADAGCILQERIEGLEEACSELETLISELEDKYNEIEEVINSIC